VPKGVYPHPPPEERFWAKVDKSGECWLWTAQTHSGYGYFNVGHEHKVRAHRWSYERFVGPIPDGLTLDHLCHNRACVRPDHLEPVTVQENLRRSMDRRRSATHCKRGHPYPREYQPDKKRQCRVCELAANRARYQLNKEKHRARNHRDHLRRKALREAA
jgi:hypothetical protein